MTKIQTATTKNLKAITLAYEFDIQISSDENSPRLKARKVMIDLPG